MLTIVMQTQNGPKLGGLDSGVKVKKGNHSKNVDLFNRGLVFYQRNLLHWICPNSVRSNGEIGKIDKNVRKIGIINNS